MNNKPLFLFVGQSASGKTTIANLLEEREGMKQVQSYTTRLPRFEGETGHIFVTEQDFPGNDNVVAYTKYNNNEYWTTVEQIKDADIYVIDVDGAEMLLKNKDKIGRDIHVIYFSSNVATRIQRMINRGSTDRQIVERLIVDEAFSWLHSLVNLKHYAYDPSKWNLFNIHEVDAGNTLGTVYHEVLRTINGICNMVD